MDMDIMDIDNDYFNKAENIVWKQAKKFYRDNADKNVKALPNLLGVLSGVSLSRGRLKNLFKRSNVGILGFKKYAKKLRDSKGDKFFEAFDNALDYLKNARNYPKGALHYDKDFLEGLCRSVTLMGFVIGRWTAKATNGFKTDDYPHLGYPGYFDFCEKFESLKNLIKFNKIYT